MMRRICGVLTVALTLIAATPTSFGGWAVVTVQELPEYLEVGQPATLAFTIRRHGEVLIDDRSPKVRFGEEGRGWLSKLFGGDGVPAARRSGSAVYEAAFTPEDTGEVTITVDTDWNGWEAQLLPIRVVAAGDRPEPLPAFERGRQLFVAKGCATCHAKLDDPVLAHMDAVPVAPALTARAFPREWLALKIANPARFRDGNSSGFRMPKLALDEHEIAALVHYLNGPNATVAGSGQ